MHVQDHLPLDELQRSAQTLPQKRIWRRFQAVILAHQGDTAEPSAHSLGCSARAVRAWVTKDNRGGPQALHERPHTGRPPRLAGAELLRFQERLEAGPTPTDGVCTFYGRDLQHILEQEFGVLMSLQAVYDLLHRHGVSSLMPRPQHKEADEELPAIFQEVVVDPIQAIKEAHPDEEVPVGFEDEARFGQQGTLTRVWARRGTRPRRVRQTQYTFLIRADGGLCQHGSGLGADRSDAQRRGGEPVPGAVLPRVACRGACGALVGRGGLSYQ